jgi:hypothetical protein
MDYIKQYYINTQILSLIVILFFKKEILKYLQVKNQYLGTNFLV